MKRRLLAALLALCAALSMLPGTALAVSLPMVSFNGHTYQLIEAPLNWHEAKTACEEMGGHLATITSAAEQSFIESLMLAGTKNHYWLGATDSVREGTWQWITGEPFSYTNWDRIEPNDYLNKEDYLQIFRVANPSVSGSKANKWNDMAFDCTTSAIEKDFFNLNVTGYICEWESDLTRVTITFNANGGSVTPKSKVYTANAVLGTLPTPTRTGYTFTGWYTAKSGGKKVTASTKATADATLYARWTKNPTASSYTLTFNPNGGMCSTTTKKVTANATYGTLPAAHRTGYTFSGWYTAKSGGTKVTSTTKATANTTLYARWTKTKRTYQVNFNANGGDVLQESKSVVRGSAYQAMPTPIRPGYHFTGWYTKASGGVKITEKTKVNLTANQTLYAHWSTAAVKAASTKSGNWRISVPFYYNVMLYSSSVSASPTGYIPEKSSAQTLACTKMATLSNGTTRYYTKLSNGKSYWFTYTCEMDVN